MASVQDRLPINRSQLDKWTTREQLCLASAVSCSGENWMSVSRTLKLLCGSHNLVDFSQKSCALQYDQLLENVEATKRKKRSSESGSGTSSPATETPTDAVLRRLTEDRVQELKAEMRREQEEYAKIYGELKAMQSGQLTEEQLLEMWRDIEQQQESQRIEEMKLENQIREREQQRKQEMQRNWRSTAPTATETTAAIDMDVEEIIGTGKAILAAQQQQQQQTATSPLLSSLLKSPNASTTAAATPPTPTGNNSARATAPTITTLLTSGSIPPSNQPTIILKSFIPPTEAVQLLTRPISGPPTDTLGTPAASTQNLLSPSQSAPTLSMLLEKNKTAHSSHASDAKASDGSVTPKLEVKAASDSNNEEVPMDIEEDVVAASAAAGAAVTGEFDSDEADANEEQQLLEVFKNIGNIDELDIDVAAVIDDEEVDFLKGVDEEPANEAADDVMDFETKLTDSDEVEEGQQRTLTTTSTTAVDAAAKNLEELHQATVAQAKSSETAADACKVETISSDDSNDNIPLAAVASLESKDRSSAHASENTQEHSFLKEKVESAIKNEDAEARTALQAAVDAKGSEDTISALSATEAVASTAVDSSSSDGTNNFSNAQKSPPDSESSDVIVIPTDDDESNGPTKKPEAEKLNEVASNEAPTRQEHKEAMVQKKNKEDHEMVQLPAPAVNENTAEPTVTSEAECDPKAVHDSQPTISIADTDEDSSTTDVSITTRKDDKGFSSAGAKQISSQQQQQQQQSQPRKSDQKPDDDNVASSANAAIPARPPVLRKLRDRDRSESPMIDDEGTTSSELSITNQRLRRRYSSTPVIDSIPNSPASSDRDDRDTRSSKKSLLSIYNALQPHRNAALFQRAFSEEYTPRCDEICLRPMDLHTIKRHIESSAIRSVSELQRDIMLMCQNALMLFKSNSADYKAVHAFMQECQTIREFATNAGESVAAASLKTEKDTKATPNTSSSVKVRGSSRKSTRIS